MAEDRERGGMAGDRNQSTRLTVCKYSYKRSPSCPIVFGKAKKAFHSLGYADRQEIVCCDEIAGDGAHGTNGFPLRNR